MVRRHCKSAHFVLTPRHLIPAIYIKLNTKPPDELIKMREFYIARIITKRKTQKF